MAYCTSSDLQARMPAAHLTNLIKDAGATDPVTEAIADADAEIDLAGVSSWSSAQKKACSAALAIESIYARHPNRKVPEDVAMRAAHWREKLESRTGDGIQDLAVYDPTMDETDEQLDDLLSRDLY